MELFYYRNFDPSSFLSEANFNLSSRFEMEIIAHYNQSIFETPETVTLNVNTVHKRDFSIFDESNAITDAKVLVGANGAGKSTVFDEIIGFCAQRNLKFSWQLLIGKGFILIGQKVQLRAESIQKLEEVFGKFVLYSNFENSDFVKNTVVLTNTSFIQKIRDRKSSLIYYSNSLENHKLPFLSGELYSRSQSVEESISLIDISTANMIIQSNKWGLESQLKEFISEENLLSLDNYQMHNFIELYFKTDWFPKLLPDSIKSKMNITIHFGSLNYRFSQLVIETFGFNEIRRLFPNFFSLIEYKDKNYLESLYKEFINTLILKTLDKRYESFGFFSNVTDVLKDFENATSSTAFHKSESSDKTLIDLLITYLKNSEYLKSIEGQEIYESFKKFVEFLQKDQKLATKLILSRLDDSEGITFSVIENHDLIKDFVDSYSRLQSMPNFRLPFLKFSPSKLSSGERNYLFLLSRLIRNIDQMEEIANSPDTFCVLMDEPGNDYHPQWQKEFFFNVNNALNVYSKNKRRIKVQLIISTHSPFILSDFDSSYIIKLKREGDKTLISSYNNPTFGANIYDLLADSFYLEDDFIGEYAKNKIQDLIYFLNFDSKKEASEINIKPTEDWDIQKVRSVIAIIGEPFLKEQLQSLYYIKYKDEYLKEKRIQELQEEIDRLNNA